MALTKKKKIALRIVIGIAIFLALAVFVNFIPVFSLKTAGMKQFSGNWINVYYETEEAAARDVFEYADGETAAIAEKLGFTEKQDINVYIYDNQSTMQTKKYGLIAPLLGRGLRRVRRYRRSRGRTCAYFAACRQVCKEPVRGCQGKRRCEGEGA